MKCCNYATGAWNSEGQCLLFPTGMARAARISFCQQIILTFVTAVSIRVPAKGTKIRF
jgi:hypothetical protein